MSAQPAKIGHNRPPLPSAEELMAQMNEANADRAERTTLLLASVGRMPNPLATPEHVEGATTLAKQLKLIADDYEAERKAEQRPFDELVKVIRGWYAQRVALVEPARQKVLDAITAFQRRERERAEAEEKARREAEAKERREAKAKAAGEPPPPPPPPPPPAEPPKTAIKTAYGNTASSRTVWHFEVVDPSKVPLAYLTPDEKAIREAVRSGVREIAGIRIYSEQKAVVS